MASTKPATVRTEEHDGPRREQDRAKRAALVVAFPEPRALPFPVAGEVVGRDWFERNGVVDARISGRHIAFHRPGGNLFIEDAGSRNGCWVNGARLGSGERVPISDGALIRVGRTLLVYRDDFVGGDAPSPPLGRLVGPFGLRRVVHAIETIAARQPTNVLIEGETGTGKELIARAVAEAAGRATKYAPVNVAGVAAGVFESQLFGYVAGAYSGSGKGSDGVFAAHNGGTVFLDEIGELRLDLQAKLLRVLDNREVLPVGAVRPTHVDVLVVAATNRSLEEMVEQGGFRRDLLARLAAARIELPPLRERIEDLFSIAQAIVAARGESFAREQVEVEAAERLMLHEWRGGNVREVASTLERLARIEPPPVLRLETVERVLGPLAGATSTSASGVTLEQVQRALAEAGSESAAARRLGISRGKLRRMLEASRG